MVQPLVQRVVAHDVVLLSVQLLVVSSDTATRAFNRTARTQPHNDSPLRHFIIAVHNSRPRRSTALHAWETNARAREKILKATNHSLAWG
jgi:hypothetical protein